MENMARVSDGLGGPEVMQYPTDRGPLPFDFGAKIVASKLAPTGHP